MRRWPPTVQILATCCDSRVGSWTPIAVGSPLTSPSLTGVSPVVERGASLTVRYQRWTGAHFAPLGGAPGARSGELSARGGTRIAIGPSGSAEIGGGELTDDFRCVQRITS